MTAETPGLRAVVGALISNVTRFGSPDSDTTAYADFIDGWSDRIHAASGVPRMQQQMAEDRKALAAARAGSDALRAALERLYAEAHYRPDPECPAGYRVGRLDGIDACLSALDKARAALAPSPAAPEREP